MPRVQEVQLSFDSLADLDDGRINKLLLQHISRVAQDCMNRPGDKTKRTVSLDFHVVPTIDPETRECEQVKVEIEAKSKVPTYRSKTYEMRVTKTGLLFNKDFPDALDQPPLFNQEDGRE